MVGHVYFSRDFSERFRDLLMRDYERYEVRQGYWEDVYISNIDRLPPMRINRYRDEEIREFDTLDELRGFDPSYVNDTRSRIIREIAGQLACREGELTGFRRLATIGDRIRFSFRKDGGEYVFDSQDGSVTLI